MKRIVLPSVIAHPICFGTGFLIAIMTGSLSLKNDPAPTETTDPVSSIDDRRMPLALLENILYQKSGNHEDLEIAATMWMKEFRTDPRAALAWLVENRFPLDLDRLLPSAFRGLAGTDPELTGLLLGTLPEGTWRVAALQGAIAGLETDPLTSRMTLAAAWCGQCGEAIDFPVAEWVRENPSEFLSGLAQCGIEPSDGLFRRAMEVWGTEGGLAPGAEWIFGNKNLRARDRDLLLVSLLQHSEPASAAQLLNSKALSGQYAAFQTVARNYAGIAASEAMEWVKSIPDQKTRNSAWLEAARVAIEKDPASGAVLLDEAPSEPYRIRLVAETASTFSAANPEKALEWARSQQGSALRANAVRICYDRWLERDPASAVSYVTSLEDGEEKGSIVPLVFNRLLRSDPNQAVEFARQAGGAMEPAKAQELLDSKAAAFSAGNYEFLRVSAQHGKGGER